MSVSTARGGEKRKSITLKKKQKSQNSREKEREPSLEESQL
jgi:hypothetical protein